MLALMAFIFRTIFFVVVQVDVQLIDVMWADTRRSTEEYVKYTVDVKRILKVTYVIDGTLKHMYISFIMVYAHTNSQ